MYLKRDIGIYLKSMFAKFPVISLTGPRQAGKTTLLKNEFPGYNYFNLKLGQFPEALLRINKKVKIDTSTALLRGSSLNG